MPALDHVGLPTENTTFGEVAAWVGDLRRIRANLGEVQRIEGEADPAPVGILTIDITLIVF